MRFPARRSKPRPQARVLLGLEALEDRSLLSAGPAAPVIDLSGLALNTSQYSSTDILVEFKSTALKSGAVPALAGTTAAQQLPLVPGLYEVQLDRGVSVQQALAAYSSDSNVQFAQPDYSLLSSAVPNNPMFNQQYALLNTGQNGGTPGDDIGATHAWSVTTGSASTIVAVMDTGIDYDHPDLYQNIWINQAEIPKSRLAPSLGGTNPNGIQDYNHDGYVSWRDLNDPRNIGPGKITDVNGDGIIDAADILAPMVLNAQGQDTGQGGWAYAGNTQDGDTAHPNDFIGWNFVNNTNNPLDQNGHGTHVAGIIGAMGNSGVGVSGIDWQVSLMPVQFLNATGNGSISAFISGLSYAIQHGAKISNNSWSGATNDPLLSAAVQNAHQNGLIFVAAAGNGGNNNDLSPAYPSSFTYDNVVSVAAVDNNFQLASFSNYGAKSVDLAAPGVNIVSTLPNNGYGTLSGTSMATPMVTGVLALVWSEHPTWTYQQVINQVLDTVDPVPGLQGKVLTGGVLDAARAVGYNSTPPTSPTPPSTLQVVSSTVSGAAAGTFDTIQVTFNQALNASVFTNSDVALIGPNGQRITIQSFQAVSGSGGTQFNFTFSPQSTSGTYTLYIGAGILSVAGVPLASTYSNTFQLANAVTFSSTAPVGIPDVSQTTASLNVPQSLTIGRVTVNVNMANSIDGKIVLMLIAPDGTQVLLSNQEGGNGQSFSGTVFDDAAGAPIGSGQAPFTGSFRPESPLAALSGKNAQGTWKLLIVDHGTNYHVVLTSWSLTFSSAGASAAKTASVSMPELEASAGAFLANGLASIGQPASFENGVAAEGFGTRLTNILSAAVRDAGNFSLPPASAPAQPNGTTLSDDIFASVDGVDRLAELRVVVPHADRGDSAVAAEDESASSANVVDAADAAFLDF
jgi:subtilisin family serine protease/subtilisin-like proprotein convertase family protein